MTLGWAIIGIGSLADVHIAPAIARDPDSRLAAVCSRDLGRARDFARRHGAAGAYDDYQRMLDDPAIDAVYVATPNALHCAHVTAALQAGCHVLVDKPMALSIADAEHMIATADACDRRLAVGFQMRHKATNRTARELLTAGRLGAVRVADIAMGAGRDTYPYHTWRSDPELSGGGTLLHQGTHAFDLLRYLTGREIVEVSATTSTPELEDVFVATLRLDDGMLATVSTHSLRPAPHRHWQVIGEDGWLEGRGALSPRADDELVLHGDDGDQVLASSPVSAYEAEVAAFVAAARGEAPVNGDGTDGLRNVAVVEALYRSAREGRRVAIA